MRLLTPAAGNTKTAKTAAKHGGIQLHSLALMPAYIAKGLSTCPHSSAGCRAACVAHSGMSQVFVTIDRARTAKAEFLRLDKLGFLTQLFEELDELQRRADASGLTNIVRFNTFSDIPYFLDRYAIRWNGRQQTVFDAFPRTLGYDYTKNPGSMRPGVLPGNYHLCFSRSETNEGDALNVLANGGNVSIVFYQDGAYAGNAALRQDLPATWNGYKVFDGDASDIRVQGSGFDPIPTRTGRGRVCGLRLKGTHEMRRQAIESGFAVLIGEPAVI